MTNAVEIFSKKGVTLAAAFGNTAPETDEFTQGAGIGFPVLSFRGKTWRMKHRGEETIIPGADGDAATSVEIVLLRANPGISKIYYQKKYTEGADDKPACFSVDGKAPDANAAEPQSKTCAACPHAAFGSRITEDGKKAKACSDSRRVAVVPAQDIPNEAGGGPMLLRISPTSLGPLADYANQMKGVGAPLYAVATKIGFDPDTAYPKLTFKAVRVLDDDEAKQVLDLRDGEDTLRVLQSVAEETGMPAEDEAPEMPPEEEPKAEAKPKAKKAETKKPAAALAAEGEEEAAEADGEAKADEEEADEVPDDSIKKALDNLLGGLE